MRIIRTLAAVSPLVLMQCNGGSEAIPATPIAFRALINPASLDARESYSVIPKNIDLGAVSRWLVLRIELGERDPGEAFDGGWLVPVYDDAVDVDWIFSHGIFFRSHGELESLLRSIVAQGQPVVGDDMEVWLVDPIWPLFPYGRSLPTASDMEAPHTFEKSIAASKTVYIEKLNGQKQGTAAIVYAETNLPHTFVDLLQWAVAIRNPCELHALLANAETGPGDDILLAFTVDTEQVAGNDAFTYFAPDDPIVEWLRKHATEIWQLPPGKSVP